MKWFPVDSDNTNDPKIKALIRVHGRDGYGAWMMLCSYVADHGKGEPGLALKADGSALPLAEMADELLFRSVDELHVFLGFLAERSLIHPKLWADKQVVFLPAMWRRMIGYAKNKGRTISPFQTVEAIADWVIQGCPVTARPVPQRPATPPQRPAKARKSPEKPLQHNTRQDNTTQTKERSAAEGAAPQLPGIPASEPKAHPIKAVLEFHDALFLKATGSRYPNYTDGDAKNVGLMLKKTSQDDLQAEFQFMFDCQDDFVKSCGYTIGAFLKLRPKLIVLKAKGNRGDPGSGRTGVEAGKYADAG